MSLLSSFPNKLSILPFLRPLFILIDLTLNITFLCESGGVNEDLAYRICHCSVGMVGRFMRNVPFDVWE